MPLYDAAPAGGALDGNTLRVSDGGGSLTVDAPASAPLAVEPPLDPFGYGKSVQKTPQIALLSAFGTSALRDVETVAGSGAISLVAGEIKVATGATASSSALLETARWGNYQPGLAAEVGIGLRIPTAPTGEQVARWGLREGVSDNGLYFGMDASGLFIARLSGGTETVVRQANWNRDPLDGTGESGVTLDPADGAIYHVDFTHYGHGDIEFQVVLTVDGVQKPVTVHVIDPSGAISTEDPNTPIFVEAENGATAADFAVYVGGRQYSLLGRADETFRYTAASRGSVSTSTTVEPLVTFRAKSAYQNRTVQVDGYEAIVATADVLLQIYLDATLTGASYATPGDHTAVETAVEADVSATAMTGGTLVWQQLLKAGQNAQSADSFAEKVRLTLPAQQPVTLAAKTLSGSGTIISNFRVRELW